MVTISKMKKLKQRNFPWTIEPVKSELRFEPRQFIFYVLCCTENSFSYFFESGFQL